ncbi:hypothetical protein [Bdellovibrio sp. ArHS]|uniref:hypothetical protein n=1 Tax=Bdellovibrio sp. ArHS TaxID=1569284 RepID=UPI0025C1AF30|nr:hypothetical protein [Bdellovibrio sp. ArHS]
MRKLLEDGFLQDLNAIMAQLLGRNAKFVIGVAHLHNSPRVKPLGKEVVELADVMFHLDFEYGVAGDPQKRLNEKRAYLFQVKQTENEDNASTRNQKALYEWRDKFAIETPLQIDPKQTLRDFSNSSEIKKSGFWFIDDARTNDQISEKILQEKSPRLEHRDGGNVGPIFDMKNFLGALVKAEAGRASDLTDDWSIIINEIIKYKTEKGPEKWATTGSAFHALPVEWPSLNVSFTSIWLEIWKKFKNFFSKTPDQDENRKRPFILISIRVYTSEYKENVFWSIDRSRSKN